VAINGDGYPCVDNVARERAESALETARGAYEEIGTVTREISGLRLEVKEGFSRLARRLEGRASIHDVEKVVEDHAEITAVTNLKAEVKKLRRREGLLLKWVLSIIAAVIVALICSWIGIKEAHGERPASSPTSGAAQPGHLPAHVTR
jgi:hypothetical protein